MDAAICCSKCIKCMRNENRRDVRGTEELPIVLDSDGEEIDIDSSPAVVHAKGSPFKLICTKRHW